MAFCWLLGSRGETYRPILTAILRGSGATAALVFGSILGGLLIGIVVGTCRLSRWRPVCLAACVYVEVIRGIPLLVMLFMTYFGLNQFLPVGAKLGSLEAATLCFSIVYGAYLGEIVRAGIQAIPPEEIEAASMDANKWQALRHVVLPRCFHLILPAAGNEFIALLKDSAIVAIIAINDITRSGQLYAQKTFLYFETYLLMALVYLAITLILSWGVKGLERRWKDS